MGLVYTDYNVNDGSKTIREFKHPYRKDLLWQACIVSTNSAIRKSVLDKVGYFNVSLYGVEDYEMWLRLTMICEAYHIPEALFTYRMHGANLTSNYADYMMQQIPLMKERLLREGYHISSAGMA